MPSHVLFWGGARGRFDKHIQKRRKQCDHKGRYWSEATTSQMLAATRSGKWKGMDFLLELLEGAWFRHLDFSTPNLISEFWPPEVWENKAALLQTTVLMVISYSSPRKWKHHFNARGSFAVGISRDIHWWPVYRTGSVGVYFIYQTDKTSYQ